MCPRQEAARPRGTFRAAVCGIFKIVRGAPQHSNVALSLPIMSPKLVPSRVSVFILNFIKTPLASSLRCDLPPPRAKSPLPPVGRIVIVVFVLSRRTVLPRGCDRRARVIRARDSAARKSRGDKKRSACLRRSTRVCDISARATRTIAGIMGSVCARHTAGVNARERNVIGNPRCSPPSSPPRARIEREKVGVSRHPISFPTFLHTTPSNTPRRR